MIFAPVDLCGNLLSALDPRNGVISMRTSPHLRVLLIKQYLVWTTVLVITLYNSVWCIHGHIHWCMQHNFLFPKVASSQCASLWRDVRTARVRWLCWQFVGHFRPEIPYGALPRRSRNLHKMLPIYSTSIWHKAFDPPRRAAIYNLTESPTAKSLTGILQRIRSVPGQSSPKCGWRHENDFLVMGNVH